MIEQEILIAGMFRSGTTLLARLFSDHPRGLVVSDPFVYFFKHYRELQLEALGVSDRNPDEPNPDYFCGEHRELLDRLLAADLSEPVPPATRARLEGDIRAWKSAQHPELCERLHEVQAETFAELYRGLILLAVEVYGGSEVAVAGTKVSWCEEFLPALARAFPDMRFVLPVRDLRAVIASQNSQRGVGEGRRPLLFYVRHWRKSVALSYHYAHHSPLLRGRVTLVRYEDLVAEPDATFERLCTHVGLDAACPSPSVSTGANHWDHNSSFENAGSGIFTDSTQRWRKVLSSVEIEAIEALAGPELALLGYPLSASRRLPGEFASSDCEPKFEQLSPWLKPFRAAAYLRDPAVRRAEYAIEDTRRAVLESDTQAGSQVERDLFLMEGLLPVLREAWA